MFLSYDVDNFPLYKERKKVIFQRNLMVFNSHKFSSVLSVELYFDILFYHKRRENLYRYNVKTQRNQWVQAFNKCLKNLY